MCSHLARRTGHVQATGAASSPRACSVLSLKVHEGGDPAPLLEKRAHMGAAKGKEVMFRSYVMPRNDRAWVGWEPEAAHLRAQGRFGGSNEPRYEPKVTELIQAKPWVRTSEHKGPHKHRSGGLVTQCGWSGKLRQLVLPSVLCQGNPHGNPSVPPHPVWDASLITSKPQNSQKPISWGL